MTKTISVSDEVYERLKREKGDRNFSEVIADLLDERRRIEDIAGQGIFDSGTDSDSPSSDI